MAPEGKHFVLKSASEKTAASWRKCSITSYSEKQSLKEKKNWKLDVWLIFSHWNTQERESNPCRYLPQVFCLLNLSQFEQVEQTRKNLGEDSRTARSAGCTHSLSVTALTAQPLCYTCYPSSKGNNPSLPQRHKLTLLMYKTWDHGPPSSTTIGGSLHRLLCLFFFFF